MDRGIFYAVRGDRKYHSSLADKYTIKVDRFKFSGLMNQTPPGNHQ